MRIDTDLRRAVEAASRQQKSIPYDQEEKEQALLVAPYKRKHSKAIKAAVKHIMDGRELEKKAGELKKHGEGILAKLGLVMGYRDTQPTLSHRENERQNYVMNGGKMAPIKKRNWKPDEVIARLAAVKPDQRDAILAEYGINWQ